MTARNTRPDPMQRRTGTDRGGEFGRVRRAVGGALGLTWRASHRGFVTAAVFQVSGAFALAGLVLAGKFALTRLFGAGATTSELVLIVVALSVLAAIGSGATALQAQQQRLLGEQVSVQTWQRMLDVTARVELEYYESPQFYDQLDRVRTHALVRPSAVTTSVFGLVGSAIAIVGLLAVLVSIDPLLVPILLLAGVPSVLLGRRVSRVEFRHISTATPLFRAREYLREVLTGREEAKEVRAFTMEGALRARHDERTDLLMTMLSRHIRRRQCYTLASVATTATALALSLGLLVWFVSIGRIEIASAVAAALGVRLMSQRLDMMFQSVSGLLESSVFLEDLDRFKELTTGSDVARTGHGPALRRSITVDNVSYTYPGSTQLALEDVSLSIGATEVVAIVGESGSGKTTLAKIIAGLYAPLEGTVRWDEVDVTALAPSDLRQSVSVIFQDFVRYQLTARENIGLGDPDHVDDLDAVRDVAARAGAAGFLENLPDGYDTILSREFAGGTDLSLGQWQRVALARALRRDAPLVILDEPSASLDPKSEDALFADVRSMLRGRAAVLISHRYSTVRSADRIIVMQDGRLLEHGTHDELIARAGLYAEMFSIQAKAYT